MMIRSWIFFIFAYITTGIASEAPLLDRLASAKPDDFVIWEAGKTITLLAIRPSPEHTLIFEEISAPSPKKRPNWAEWLRKGAPGHTSWSMLEIDLRSQEILEVYSFTKSSWLSTASKDSLLGTLLHLPLAPLPQENLRRIGPPPMEGEADLRKIWAPPLFVEGRRVEEALFDVFETKWPSDGSELSDKTIQLYFEKRGTTPWPCWVQIDAGQITATLRAIDSGSKLPSSHRRLPRRTPTFTRPPMRTKEGGLRFFVKSPRYYKSFELFAIDTTNPEKEIHLLTHSVIQASPEMIHLEIDAEELGHQLIPNHQYTWLLVPADSSGSYSELSKPFLWVP
jgi:hypothetical protein